MDAVKLPSVKSSPPIKPVSTPPSQQLDLDPLARISSFVVRPGGKWVPVLGADQLPAQITSLLRLPRDVDPRTMDPERLRNINWIDAEKVSDVPLEMNTKAKIMGKGGGGTYLAPDAKIRMMGLVKCDLAELRAVKELEKEGAKQGSGEGAMVPSLSLSRSPARAVTAGGQISRPGMLQDDRDTKSLVSDIAQIYRLPNTQHATRSSPYNASLSRNAPLLPPSGIPPDPLKKEYCTYWIKTGDCSFVSQGCLYKHEMPPPDKLREIGFSRVPKWWTEKNAIKPVTWLSRRMEERKERENQGCEERSGGMEKEKERYAEPGSATERIKSGIVGAGIGGKPNEARRNFLRSLLRSEDDEEEEDARNRLSKPPSIGTVVADPISNAITLATGLIDDVPLIDMDDEPADTGGFSKAGSAPVIPMVTNRKYNISCETEVSRLSEDEDDEEVETETETETEDSDDNDAKPSAHKTSPNSGAPPAAQGRNPLFKSTPLVFKPRTSPSPSLSISSKNSSSTSTIGGPVPQKPKPHPSTCTPPTNQSISPSVPAAKLSAVNTDAVPEAAMASKTSKKKSNPYGLQASRHAGAPAFATKQTKKNTSLAAMDLEKQITVLQREGERRKRKGLGKAVLREEEMMSTKDFKSIALRENVYGKGV